MSQPRSQSVLAFALAVALGVGVIASTEAEAQGMTPRQVNDARKANMRDIVGARKVIDDQLKTDEPILMEIRYAAAELVMHSNGMAGWFPKGSGAQPGLRTKSKDTIWTDSRGFAAELKTFQATTAALDAAAKAGDIDAVRVQIVKVGESCASCHDKYREK